MKAKGKSVLFLSAFLTWLFIGPNLWAQVCAIDGRSTITTVAGNGTPGFSGDGGRATSAELNSPFGVAFDNTGNLYISDTNNHRIRKMDTRGIITTVVGNGAPGISGDSGPATEAQLYEPTGVAVDSASNLYIADFRNRAVRRMDTRGIITTFAVSPGREPLNAQGLAVDSIDNL